VMFSLAAFDALLGYRDDPKPSRAALFGLTASLGFLSHLMFLNTFVAALAWMPFALLRRAPLPLAARRMVVLFGPATAFLVGFYFLDVRGTTIGGGPPIDIPSVFVQALSYALGGPRSGLLALVVARDADLRSVHGNGHPHGAPPHRGQVCAYRATAVSRSMPSTFASEASQASTSPNSCSRFERSPVRIAFASSPISSVNHRNVASRPRLVSRSS